jgi:hypothetical protein
MPNAIASSVCWFEAPRGSFRRSVRHCRRFARTRYLAAVRVVMR